MKVGYLITARLKSTRLPKKLLLEIQGKPIISHMIDRLKLARNIDDIVICTSKEKQDLPLEAIARENNIECYKGDPDDVLLRLLNAAEKFSFDYILNITADCPFVDPIYADNIVDKYIETNADLITQFSLPHGVFSYGIKVDALRKVIESKDSSDTEAWGRYFTDTGQFDVRDLDVSYDYHNKPQLRMTLDYPEDFEFFNRIFNELYNEGSVFTLDQILDLLESNPKIVDINKHCAQMFKKKAISQSEPSFKKICQVETALIIGAGSIGQRHIKNLKQIGIKNIIALRSKKGHYKELPKELKVIEVDNWDSAEVHKADIAIISNPTSLHIDAALKAAKYVKGIFIEKPLSHSLKGCNELISFLDKKRVVSFVGHNNLFHPIVNGIQNIKDDGDLGEIVNIQCQVGQWLPDWHPYEDYKKSYYSRKDLGGGVALTLIHEIHLALELAGTSRSVSGIISEYSKLDVDVDVDVCSDLMIKHKSGAVSQIHLDYIQRPSHRSGLITFEKGWVSYDFTKQELLGQINGASTTALWSDNNYSNNKMYIDQMKKFILYTEEGRINNIYNASSAIESLRVVEALFMSDSSGMRVNVEDVGNNKELNINV